MISDNLEDCIKLIGEQIKASDVMLYMKGTPSAPQCGFSQQVKRLFVIDHFNGIILTPQESLCLPEGGENP